MSDDAAQEPQQTIALLQRDLTRYRAERDEALEQQRATSEILSVINSSKGDLAPVFDRILEKAMLLCEAAFGDLYTYDGESFKTAAVRGAPSAYVEARRQMPPNPFSPGTVSARILATKRPVHVLDHRAGVPSRRVVSELGGARTVLCVPLLRNDVVAGFIMIYRREVRWFSERQVALLENFAAQAVIAMENARLLRDLQERTEESDAGIVG